MNSYIKIIFLEVYKINEIMSIFTQIMSIPVTWMLKHKHTQNQEEPSNYLVYRIIVISFKISYMNWHIYAKQANDETLYYG